MPFRARIATEKIFVGLLSLTGFSIFSFETDTLSLFCMTNFGDENVGSADFDFEIKFYNQPSHSS